MKKKALAVFLTAVVAAGTVACGSSPAAQSTTSKSTTDDSQSAESSVKSATGESEDNPVVTFSYPTLVVTPTPEGTAPVEEALNQYLASIGKKYTVDLNPIDGNNYATQTDMAIMSNENIGIYCPLSGISGAVAGNKVLSLEPYLDKELKPIVDLEGEKMIKGGEVNGVSYGMPAYTGIYCLYYYWIVDKDIFDATGYSEKDITDIRSLTPIFEKIHEQNPDIAVVAPTLGLNGSGNNYVQLPTMGASNDYKVTDLGSNLGLIVEGESNTVENLYATQYFKEACELAYDWNQKGLTVKDASVSTDTPTDTQQAGRSASNFIGYAYSQESVANFTKNTYAFPIAKTMATSTPLLWCLASNCSNPQESCDFLSLLYTDKNVINYVIYGVEGEDYTVTGQEDGVTVIAYPEGKDMNTVSYTAQLSCGILGNQFNMYAIQGGVAPVDVHFMENNMKNLDYSPIFGFQADVSSFTTEASAITNAAKQYTGGLLCGELDPNEYIPKLIDAVNAAGMEDAISRTQSQLDAWKKAQ